MSMDCRLVQLSSLVRFGLIWRVQCMFKRMFLNDFYGNQTNLHNLHIDNVHRKNPEYMHVL